MFNARTYRSERGFFSLHHGKGFITIALAIVVGQIAIVELLYNFFNVQPMFHTADWAFNAEGFKDWLIIVLLSSLVLWLREAWRYVGRRLAR